MNLTNLFRLHAILAAIYGFGLLLAPQSIVSLLSPLPLNPVGTDIARLFGAALILVMFIAWGGSHLTHWPSRRMVARGLLVYTTLGAIISIWGQLAGTWGALGWSTIVSYLIFVLGYGYFLFVKPDVRNPR
jgi:hypothetical protein